MEEKKEEQTILFPLGYHRPSDTVMKHFAYVGINERDIVFIDTTKQYFFNLFPKPFDVIVQTDWNCTKSFLKFNNHDIASTYCYARSINFSLSASGIALALNQLDNLLTIPELDFSGDVSGTVEAVIKGIKNNCYTSYSLKSPPMELATQYQYEAFSSAKAALLIDALRVNDALEELYLRGVYISKIVLLELIEVLKTIPKFKKLDLCKAHLDIDPNDIPELMKALSGTTFFKFNLMISTPSGNLSGLIKKCQLPDSYLSTLTAGSFAQRFLGGNNTLTPKEGKEAEVPSENPRPNK